MTTREMARKHTARRGSAGRSVLAALLAVLLVMSAWPAFAGEPAFAAAAPSKAEKAVDAKAERILSQMTTDEKVAQMMVVAFPAKDAASVQKKYQFGGYILFGRDFKRTSKSGMKKKLAACQKASKAKMLLAVDEEGGTVVRASLYKKYRKKKFRSPRRVYSSGGYKAITSDTKKKDLFLRSLGLNCNFAPVADVPYKKSNFMYKRSFSTSVSKTKKFIRLCVTRMGTDNVVCVMKHFPGYGKNGDTHGKIIRDKRGLITFKTRDLRPFAEGIDAGADMIMVSHIIVNAFDRKNPASLSKNVNRYLRSNMGFDGVIITDGLGMKGVTDFVGGSQGEAAVRAVKAGNDMLCVTGNYKKCYTALRKAVRSGSIPKSQVDASVKRILKMKIRRGIIR